MSTTQNGESVELTACQAGKDGECIDPQCPQARDGEPEKTGRFCPLPGWEVDSYE